MNVKLFLPFILGIGLYGIAGAQTCTTLGQTPQTAFPVCGTQSFQQSLVNLCGNRLIAGRCDADEVEDKNPFWYKFTCFESGTLGFEIIPKDLGDDYDWQLFDMTNSSPEKVYTDKNIFVACNWSGESGKTGASANGRSLIVCGGKNQPLYSSMPELIKGHNYLLLISHFTESQSGYNLTFAGGTANITDPKDPHLQSASANCEGNEVTVVLNKKMKCASLAADGSDFVIEGGNSLITAARSASCNTSFDIDSVVLQLDRPLPPGSYRISVKNGSDANTIFDNCERNIPAADRIDLKILPVQPTPMDSLAPVSCAPGSVRLFFKKNIRCASIDPGGSDFVVNGSYPVTVTGASGVCSNGLSNSIEVSFSTPLTRDGNFQIRLKAGSDGNTLIDECGEETLPASLSFTVRDTVSATFRYDVVAGCKTDIVQFYHPAENGVNQWKWIFNNNMLESSPLQYPVKIYTTTGDKAVTLMTTNGFCSDTASATISLAPKMKADFETPNILCAVDKAVFTDKSSGNIVSWKWDFGNQTSSSQPSPSPVTYPLSNTEKKYAISLVVTGSDACTDTLVKQLLVVGNCFIAVPSGFTPNGDGLNDFLFPSNAYKAVNLIFRVYNRYGQLVFQTKDWTRKWDGTINGRVQAPGAYVWTLTYTNKDTGKAVSQKGTTTLIR